MHVSTLRISFMALALGTLGACGGHGDAPAAPTRLASEVAQPTTAVVAIRSSHDVVDFVAYQNRKRLEEGGVPVASVSCLEEAAPPAAALPGEPAFLPRPSVVAYLYTIGRKDVDAAVRLGFEADFDASRFAAAPFPCDRRPSLQARS